ncbi:hypothetical protein ACFWD7_50775 [Streptomyces mirabilis]|uniref:hypothetical protein n=1 Tax=Streptomyces mirabilis TaxID=68239 RepID=UPI0021C0989F|nr:hypothetical protein [Streptomyces mirabilis]MCT9114198.1 hypothetical protein [Streptomyces mirabilis]
MSSRPAHRPERSIRSPSGSHPSPSLTTLPKDGKVELHAGHRGAHGRVTNLHSYDESFFHPQFSPGQHMADQKTDQAFSTVLFDGDRW